MSTPLNYQPRHRAGDPLPRHRGTTTESPLDRAAIDEAERYGVDLTRRGTGRHL